MHRKCIRKTFLVWQWRNLPNNQPDCGLKPATVVLLVAEADCSAESLELSLKVSAIFQIRAKKFLLHPHNVNYNIFANDIELENYIEPTTLRSKNIKTTWLTVTVDLERVPKRRVRWRNFLKYFSSVSLINAARRNLRFVNFQCSFRTFSEMLPTTSFVHAAVTNHCQAQAQLCSFPKNRYESSWKVCARYKPGKKIMFHLQNGNFIRNYVFCRKVSSCYFLLQWARLGENRWDK